MSAFFQLEKPVKLNVFSNFLADVRFPSNSKLAKYKSFGISVNRLHPEGQEYYSDAILVVF